MDEEYNTEDIEIIDDEPNYDAIYDEQHLEDLDKLYNSLDFKLIKTIKYYECGDYDKLETYDENNNLIVTAVGRKPNTKEK